MKFKRHPKNYLIAPKKQLLYSFFTIVPVFLGVGLNTLLIIRKIREISQEGGLTLGSDLEIVKYCLISFIITILVVGLFTFILSIIVSHRVFGSLYGVEKYFRDLIEGKERGPITTRQLDSTENLVAVLNEYLEKTKDKK